MQHDGLEDDWMERSIAYQMANIGSEVSRSIKNQDKPVRFKGAYERALELFDLTMLSLQKQRKTGELREVCRAREEFCDFFNGNSFGTDAKMMQKYYDEFAMILG